MPRPRSTPFAILGMLSVRPMSGYDIRREAATSIGHFWSESYGQIYPALAELASRGLARRHAARGTGRRERNVYEITPRGTAALRRWLAEPPRIAPVRSELLLKLFFGDSSSLPAHIGWLEERLADALRRRREYAALRRQVVRDNPGHPSLDYWLATLNHGEHHADSIARWCRSTLATFRRKRAVRSRAGSHTKHPRRRSS